MPKISSNVSDYRRYIELRARYRWLFNGNSVYLLGECLSCGRWLTTHPLAAFTQDLPQGLPHNAVRTGEIPDSTERRREAEYLVSGTHWYECPVRAPLVRFFWLGRRPGGHIGLTDDSPRVYDDHFLVAQLLGVRLSLQIGKNMRVTSWRYK